MQLHLPEKLSLLSNRGGGLKMHDRKLTDKNLGTGNCTLVCRAILASGDLSVRNLSSGREFAAITLRLLLIC